MTQDDVLFGYRLQLFDLAARTTVANACRTFGVHRSTYYRWNALVDRQGLEMLRPRERRRPVMQNQLPMVIEEQIVAFSLGHPGLGPKRIAAQLQRPEWGGLVISPKGVWKVLRSHGISTGAKRLSLIAGYRAPYEPPSEPQSEPHIDAQRPGQLV
jgi:transposase